MKKWNGLNINVINMKALVETVAGNARSTACGTGSGGLIGGGGCGFFYWF